MPVIQSGYEKMSCIGPHPGACQCTTNMINIHARGKAVICGDWNSRHKRWDRTSNRRGNQLVRWANSKRWDIHPWEGFSFKTQRYESNIDLFATKGVEIGSDCSPEDVWTGNLHHRPIATTFLTKQEHKDPAKRRISVKLWRDQTKASKVLESYRRKFPEIIKSVKECNRRKDLDAIYNQIVETPCAPWREGKPTPLRYSSFWSDKLDHLSQLKRSSTKTLCRRIQKKHGSVTGNANRV